MTKEKKKISVSTAKVIQRENIFNITIYNCKNIFLKKNYINDLLCVCIICIYSPISSKINIIKLLISSR